MTDLEKTQEPQASDNPAADIAENRNMALAMFLFPLIVILALLMDDKKNSPFLRFWANQLIVLSVANIVAVFVNIIPLLGQIAYMIAALMLFIFWIIALVSIKNGECKPLPIIGEIKII